MGPRGGDRVGEASVDIAEWLHGLGLQQYEQAFCDNAIDERGATCWQPHVKGADDNGQQRLQRLAHGRRLARQITVSTRPA